MAATLSILKHMFILSRHADTVVVYHGVSIDNSVSISRRGWKGVVRSISDTQSLSNENTNDDSLIP